MQENTQSQTSVRSGGITSSNSAWSICVAIALLLLLIALKWPVRTLPYHWDEMGAYVTPARELAQHDLQDILFGFRPSPDFFGHPPLLYVTLALTYKVFGFSILVSHAYVLFWSFLCLFYTYRLGLLLFNRAAGIIAALFLLFTPLYFAQSGMVLGEIPIAALGVMAVYYALQCRVLPCVLCGIAAVLTKETAVAIPAAIALYAMLFQRDRYRPIGKLFLLVLPIVLLAGFYLWQKAVTGQWVANPYFNTHPMGSLDAARIVRKAVWVSSFIAVRQYRLLWVLLLLLHFAIQGKSAWKTEYVLFGLIGLFFVAAFSFIYFDQRYVLAALPYLAVPAAGAVVSILPRRSARAVIPAFVLAMSASVWREHETGYNSFDYDMQYADMIAIDHAAAQCLEQGYPDARIAAAWPASQYLAHPWQGYVSRPLNVVGPKQEFDLALLPGTVPPDAVSDRLVLLKRFEKNGKILDLYRFSTLAPNRN